jgi:hypothetical protein
VAKPSSRDHADARVGIPSSRWYQLCSLSIFRHGIWIDGSLLGALGPHRCRARGPIVDMWLDTSTGAQGRSCSPTEIQCLQPARAIN